MRQRKHIRPDGTLHHRLFDAQTIDGKKQLSVYRIHNMRGYAIRKTGEELVKKNNDKLYGRADILAKKIYHRELSIIPDTTEPRRHSNVLNWPKDKGKRKNIAQELAYEAGQAIRYIDK